jgi:hypothetical protein
MVSLLGLSSSLVRLYYSSTASVLLFSTIDDRFPALQDVTTATQRSVLALLGGRKVQARARFVGSNQELAERVNDLAVENASYERLNEELNVTSSQLALDAQVFQDSLTIA